jgi:hypothetical protein
MTAIDRLLEIEARFAEAVEKIVPLEFDGDALKIVLHLKDGGTLRVVEQWKNARLEKYSYYWLAPDNSLRIGWDNVPHHKHVATFPHHTSRRPTRYESSRSLGFSIKHVGTRDTLRPSEETSLEDVLRVVLDMKSERS